MERDNIDPKRVENDMVVGHYTNKDGRLVVGAWCPVRASRTGARWSGA